MRQLVDRVVGRRLKASIDRRVRREVGRRERDLLSGLRTVVGEELRRQQRALRESVESAVSRAESGTASEIRRLRRTGDALQRQSDVDFSTGLLLGAGRRFDRRVTSTRWVDLAVELKELTGGRNPDWPMRTAYRTLLDLEARGLGRVAGSPYNIVGKLTAPLLLDPPEGPILEIGTLYGLFAAALVRQFRQAGQFRTVTVVDPFAGHQVQQGFDGSSDPTGTPVTEAVARHNLRIGGLADDDVRVVPGLSTEPAVRARLAEECFAVVVVDGDHSDEGVYADLQWVESVTRPGAIVVLDDFRDPLWPGVESATRRYLRQDGPFDLVGTAATSAYLRRR